MNTERCGKILLYKSFVENFPFLSSKNKIIHEAKRHKRHKKDTKTRVLPIFVCFQTAFLKCDTFLFYKKASGFSENKQNCRRCELFCFFVVKINDCVDATHSVTQTPLQSSAPVVSVHLVLTAYGDNHKQQQTAEGEDCLVKVEKEKTFPQK